MTRRAVGILVVAAWVLALGWHLRRESFQPEVARLAEAAMALNPGTSFYTLTMNDRVVGLANSRLDTLESGFVLEDFMSLELPALGQTGTAVARTRVELDSTLTMETFDFSLDSEVGRFQASGEVRPDSVLEVEIRSQGTTESLEFQLDAPPVFAAVVPIRVAMGGELEVGEEIRLPVFDPSTLSTRTVEVRVLAHDTMTVPDSTTRDPESGRFVASRTDTIPVWKIAESFGGVSVESWIDEDGRIVQASSPMGFSMERTEYELARQAQEDARSAGLSSPVDDDVILSTAIQSNVELDDVEAREELRFVLSGVELDGFDLEGGRQSLRGDTLVVRRESLAELDPGYDLPYPRMDLADALAPEPLIQSDDPRIQEMARQMVGRSAFDRGLDDPREAAGELTRAVYRMLDKTVTFSVPSAVQVLESRQGDCNEHTVLYVALARAVGLPARTAVGLVYLDGSFFYHAWPEVWMGEWVAVDPTFGQVPADAAHIRFVIGGLAQQVEIVRLIGRLEIEVVS